MTQTATSYIGLDPFEGTEIQCRSRYQARWNGVTLVSTRLRVLKSSAIMACLRC